jgi:hypothetical protein
MTAQTLRSLAASACLFLTATISPGSAIATCGQECDQQYASEIDDCRANFGDDPADAEDLAACIQDARDNYGSCLDNCRPVVVSSSQCRPTHPLLNVAGLAACRT